MLESPNGMKKISNLAPLDAAGPVEIYKFICLNQHHIARIFVIRAGRYNRSLKPNLNIR